MEKKDYFSRQSQAYATFRPTYPAELYEFIFHHLNRKYTAWDCATGNGQVAKSLCQYFDKVYATDISEQQLNNAFHAENIYYSLVPAEQTDFADKQFDLITVAQALHWLRLPEFYREVNRTGITGGLLAVWGYSMLTAEPAVDRLFADFYYNTVGPYWDNARKMVEDHYTHIEFPFEEIPCPEFSISVQWSAAHLTGYVSSWSATQQYIRLRGIDPVDDFREKLKSVWKADEVKPVKFPVFMRLGRINQT